jgi:hypothetical protein
MRKNTNTGKFQTRESLGARKILGMWKNTGAAQCLTATNGCAGFVIRNTIESKRKN